MEISEGERTIIRFGPFKKLIIDRENNFLEYWGGKIYFYQIMGYWKNSRPSRRRMLYYVVLLTKEKMHRITPGMGESDAEKVLNILSNIVPVEARR